MKVTQEKLPASQIGLEIEIPSELSKQSYEQVIQKFARAANIPGFRKGKVPRQILVQRMGLGQIKAAAVEDIVQDSIEKAIKQQEIEAIGRPQLRSSFEELVNQYEPGKPFTFSAAVDVQPEVKLNQYIGLQAQVEEVKYDPAKVDSVLEENREEMATLIPVEGRSAQLGDVAVVDFQGHLVSESGTETEPPEEIPGGQATDFQVELKEGRFVEGFVDGMVGMHPGETREVSAQFPEDYAQKDMAGRAAVFTVTLKELKEKELPELDDEFAQEASEFQTLAELRSSLESRFQTEAERQLKANKEQALLSELLKHLEVDLPETLIEQEVNNLLTQTAIQLGQQGLDVKKLFTPENIPQLRARSRPDAIERLRQAMALQEVAKRESLQVERAKVDARLKELKEQYADEDVDSDRLLEVVEDELLKEKIMSWLEEQATLELVPAGSLKPTPDLEEEAEAIASVDASQVPEEEVVVLTDAAPESVPESAPEVAVVAETTQTTEDNKTGS